MTQMKHRMRMIAGFRPSPRRAGVAALAAAVLGRVTGDITDLTLLMEPGEWRYAGDEIGPSDGDRQPRDKPLRGLGRNDSR